MGSCNQENTRSELTCGCTSKVLNPCWNFLSYLSVGSTVYPINAAPQHSEFFIVSPKKRLRIIHIRPDTVQPPKNSINERTNVSSRRLSEDYWFTRWSKPLKLNRCSCSFRRSRISMQPNNTKTSYEFNKKSNYDGASKKSLFIETFVEQLVHETFNEVFAENFTKNNCKNNKNGVVNLSFEHWEDDEGVVLRHKPTQSSDQKPNDQSKTVQNNKICKHQKLSTSKIVILLLHGIGSSADVWWLIIKSLTSKGYEVVAPDMLGHGFSSAPDKSSAYTFKSFVNNAVSIFDHYIGCDESKKCIIIGHSFGCSLATAIYRYRAQQIIQLILISGGGPTPLASPVQNESRLNGFLQAVLKPLLLCGMKRSFFYSSRGKHFDVCMQDHAVPNHILKYILHKQNWPEGDAAFHRRILIPTLLVYGLQDAQITLVQECEMERTIPRAFLELIPNAGHLPMLETPDYLCHMILCFIDWWSR